jgi:hypothetical protein
VISLSTSFLPPILFAVKYLLLRVIHQFLPSALFKNFAEDFSSNPKPKKDRRALKESDLADDEDSSCYSVEITELEIPENKKTH